MNSKTNETFIDITKNIFDKLFSTSLEVGSIYNVVEKKHKWDISGVIGVVGDFEGVITIRMKNDTAVKLLEKSKVDNPDIAVRWNLINDMVGEIVNNIAGNALTVLSEDKYHYSVPITVQGENHKLQWPKAAPITAIVLDMEYGSFEIQYSFLKD